MVVCETLELEGFKCNSAENGNVGLEMLSAEDYDVIIADIMMPHLDGIGMVERIRQRDKVTPILFLTAKSAVDDVVEGFNAGADDYIRKPFSMRELIVRVKALYTRVYGNGDNKIKNNTNNIPIGSYSFDPISQNLYLNGKTFQLSSRESEILKILVEQINETVESTTIMKELWGDDSYFIANSLQVFITRLRQRLKNDSSIRIINVRGVGYKLVVDLSF